jgi:cytidine deaminase
MLLSMILCTFLFSVNAGVLPLPSPKLTETLLKEIPAKKFVLSKKEVSSLKKKLGLGTERLLIELIPVAKRNALPPISNYYVGAVGLAKSGKIYFGNNLEFKGTNISQTVHAEQFLSTLSFSNYDKLEKIAISAEPCGHCRQFLNEIQGALKNLKILVPGKKAKILSELLPDSFGPDNLDIDILIYAKRDNKIKKTQKNQLCKKALKAANNSYAPYSKSYSGVAIKTKDGNIYTGFYIENAAFNPSIQPITAAVINLLGNGRSYEDIKEVVLAEFKNASVKQTKISQDLLRSIAPKAKFKTVFIES